MKDNISIVLSGEAGQGLQTIEDFLVKAINGTYHVFSTKEVMSRVRGGNNSVLIRVGNRPVDAYKEHIDILYLLNDHSYYRLPHRTSDRTVVFGDESFLSNEEKDAYGEHFTPFQIDALAKEAGSFLFANTLIFGHIAGLLSLDAKHCHQLILDKFNNKNETIQQGNIAAFGKGYELGSDYTDLHSLESIAQSPQRIITGTEAVGIGALGGGCNFIASYPMSPATGVLIYLSGQSDAFDVFVEQAEDEIAAINMTIGAWYAGARALATTSGGGFALMEEGISLSGITETPCVVHIAQRPGPGTGLPTRTAQEDLNLAVYAGHGEFRRIVLSPGHPEDAIRLSQKAFYLADKYQVPVFILTDQYLLDSKYQMMPFDLDPEYLQTHIVQSSDDYKRYKITDDGLSPRSVPGFGVGLVKCDSDEHTEEGMITEDFDVRIDQNEKRLNRNALILDDYQAADLIGPEDYDTLLVGWGSTFGVLKEYVTEHQNTAPDKTAFLYIKQPFPLSTSLTDYFAKAGRIINVENNATGQLADILKLELNVEVAHSLLKHNGVPFSIEDIITYMKEVA